MKQIVYVASSESQQIHVFDLNTKGILKLIQIVELNGQVQSLAISANKHFLYAGIRFKSRLITYRILSGVGTLVLATEFILPGSPSYISIDHRDRFLFSSSYSSNCVSIIQLENNIPIEIKDTIRELDGCHSVNISPDNQFLWVPVLKQDRICLFKISNNSKLQLQTSMEVKCIKNSGPRHMVFHPSRQYAYVINELNSSIDVWKYNNFHRKIQYIQNLSIMPVNFSGTRWASDIHITPDGKYLYACDRTSSILTIFSVIEDSYMLKIEGFQSTETQPRSFSIDDTGKFLIVAGQISHYITVYQIERTLGLLEQKGRYPVGKGPIWVIINTF